MLTRLVLLPGMDGTGDLFSEFMQAVPEPKHIQIIRYPINVKTSCPQLLAMVQAKVPASEPYFLLAESYSTPLAIEFAATNPPNLKGLILCAGFASSPLTGSGRVIASLLAPLFFHMPVSRAAIRHFLVGGHASDSLRESVQVAISSVRPDVMTARLRAVLRCDVRYALRNVACPLLYIQAERDKLVPPSCLAEIRRIQPATRVAQIDGPHLILQREPKLSADAVAIFIHELQ